MNYKRITGIVLVLLGVACFVFGLVISSKVNQGEKKIERAQRGVNTVKGLTRISPYTREAGKVATQSAQDRINQGKHEASRYHGLSIWMIILGIVLFVAGVVLVMFGWDPKKKKKKRR